MRHEGTAGVHFCELGADGGADGVDDFVLVEEVDFAFGRVHVYVYTAGVDVEAEIGKGVAAFGEEGGVGVIDGFSDGGRFDGTMVDEEEQGGLLDVIIGVAGPAGGLEAPFVVVDGELDEFTGDGASVYLTDTVHCCCGRGGGDSHDGIAMFLAGKGYTFAVNGVAAYNVENLGVFFTVGFEGFLALSDIIE